MKGQTERRFGGRGKGRGGRQGGGERQGREQRDSVIRVEGEGRGRGAGREVALHLGSVHQSSCQHCPHSIWYTGTTSEHCR